MFIRSLYQDRAEFDNMLLNHARKSGARVYEQTKIHSLTFSTDDPTRPISASWMHVPPPAPLSPPDTPVLSDDTTLSPQASNNDRAVKVEGTTSFKYLIDATGRAGIMSTKYLKNRHVNASLKNIAVWGYWTGTGTYGVGTEREGSPWFEALKGTIIRLDIRS